eukprot:TRINITY_DN520_c0_g1_i3.p1 TRINITY_DN520_c0_g1~~TRINITY_DN520_c0_g1_i3.p1  ORF type:complete len:1205 (-),score=270.48 TRINITY_DN520_c0_g1_i3:320-3934(-)
MMNAGDDDKDAPLGSEPAAKRQKLLQDDSKSVSPTKTASSASGSTEISRTSEGGKSGGSGERFVPSHWCFGGADTEMSRYASSFNWAATTLGPVETWPPSIWYACSICLTSRFPMVLWIGEDLHLFYNDAYAPVIGTRHLKKFGVPGREVFFEIWGTIGQQLLTVQKTKTATWSVDQQLIMLRHGYLEETYWTYSYSPLLSAETVNNPNAVLDGIFTAVEDTTARYLSERRLKTLRNLSAQATQAKSRVEVCEEGMKVLSKNPYDIPFAGCYLFTASTDGDRSPNLVLASSYGLSCSSNAHRLLPAKVSLGSQQVDYDSIAHVLRTTYQSKEHQLVDITNYGIGQIPPWNDEPRHIVVFPLTTNMATTSTSEVENDVIDNFGVLVVGVNSRRELDEAYLTFFKLVASQTTGSLMTAYRHEEAKKKADALAELDRAKTLFFTNISHELRTPLTLMLGPIEELLQDPKNESMFGKENTDKLHLLHRNARRLLKLVNVLLDFSRIEAGRMQATYQPADLSRLTADLASVFRSACERAGISLVVDCPTLKSNIPPYVDGSMWEKIVLNLLSNAFKFTLQGGITITLREGYRSEFGPSPSVDPTKTNNCVVLSIKDTGCGIPEHEMPRLFERFHRVQGKHRGRSFEGSGIGLALVYELVKLHGGLIECNSKEGEGTQFFITLPLGKNHLTSTMGRILDDPLVIPESDSNQSRRLDWLMADNSDTDDDLVNSTHLSGPSSDASLVLVVDDNSDMLKYVTRILQERHRVLQATDGEMALEILRQQKEHRLPDLVLSDVMMPKVDGFELLRLMQADPDLREIPIIFLSARAGEEAHSEGISVGADDYLIKPFSAKELLARVHARIELAKFRLAATRKEQLLRRAAEEANNAKDRFLAMLSHELRTPLTPALLLAEENQLNKNLNEKVREDMAMIARNIRLETQLIDDLLDLTKISQHKLQLHLQSVDAHVVLRQAIDLVICNIQDKKLHLDVSHMCAENRTVKADPVRLQQVFWNLLGNAIKFTQSGGFIRVKTFNGSNSNSNLAELSSSQNPEEVHSFLHIEVSDTGIGIDSQLLPKLFTAFEQGGDGITQQFGGLGLGLNISKALVTMHGGSLTASSEGKGRGATFEVKLPVEPTSTQIPDNDEASSDSSESSSPSPERQQPLHILLIEDNQMTCAVLVRYLSTRLGHIVKAANSKLKAEEALHNEGAEF